MPTELDHSRFVSAGLSTDGVSPSSVHLFNKIMTGIVLLALITHCLFLGVFTGLRIPALAWFNFGSLCVYAVAYWLCLTKRPLLAWLISMFEVIAHAAFATVVVGWAANFHLLMVLVLPVLCFGYLPLFKGKFPIGVTVIAVYLWLDVNYRNALPQQYLTRDVINAMYYTNTTIFLGLLSFLCALYEYIVRRSEKKLSEHATTDSLSKLKNRRAAMACAEIEFARQRRTGEPISFILCDIDFFKQINDTLGHETGDKVIQGVAAAMQQEVRLTDHCCRWGGEEFLICLPNTTLEYAKIVVERIRKHIDVKTPKEPHLLGVDLRDLKITLTFGVVEQAAGDAFANIDHIVDQADKCLYYGKKNGRNCVITPSDLTKPKKAIT